jgi:Dos2-interacting transcription regulator of RNA-Pol-II
VEGFVGLMTNEKDPHNLMLAFSILKVILVEFDIVGLQEVSYSHTARLMARNSLMPCSATSQSRSRLDRTISTESPPMI